MAYYLKGIGDESRRINEILPSFDARINKFIIGHTVGIISGEFNDFYASAIDRGVVVKGGMMQAYGYFGMSDAEQRFNFVMPSTTSYIQVYAEIDLSVIPNKFEIKVSAMSNSSEYTFRQDNLGSATNGKYQFPLWQVRLTASTIVLTDRRTYINKPLNVVNAEKSAHATLADNATRATTASTAENALKINNIEINRNTSYNSLSVKLPSASTTEYVERKRAIFSSSGATIYQTATRGTTYSLTESVSNGDLLEFEYQLETFGNMRLYFRARMYNNLINIIDFRAGQTKNSGFTAYSFYFTFSGSTMTYSNGYYLLNWANNGGSLLENGSMVLYKIYKIIGSNV